MATTDVGSTTRSRGLRNGAQRLSTETKAAWKTTELFVFIAVSIGVLIASRVMGGDEGDGGDVFTADKAWLYVSILAVGYMVSRGLAKSGSRDPYWGRSDRD
jgi:hypothetical protein